MTRSVEVKVVVVSSSDNRYGAAAAAYRLHNALISLQIHSNMLVNERTRSLSSILAPQSKIEKLWASTAPRLGRVITKLLGDAKEYRSINFFPNRTVERIHAIKPDIVNLHWVNNEMLRIEAMANIQQPLVWTLHDMWPFCGAEHYGLDERRWREGYLPTNRPANESRFDINRWTWQRKHAAWRQHVSKWTIVSPSRWLARCAQESALLRESHVAVIPNGIDTRIYRPIDKSVARDLLQLPQDRKLILFGAMSATSDARKGFPLLRQALKHLASTAAAADTDLVVFGAEGTESAVLEGFKVRFLGRLNDDLPLVLAYSGADVFVAPSIQDNLPNTVMESIACGTPTVAFNIGGMPDMIDHEKNGYLARPFETEDLARGLNWVLQHPDSTSLRTQARLKVENNFTLRHQAESYAQLFEQVLQRS